MADYGIKQGPEWHSVTIANGATVSGIANLLNGELQAVLTPAALTGTTMTFQGCDTAGGTFVPIHKEDGNAYSITVAANRITKVDPSVFRGVRFLKVVSGSAEGAARIIKLATREVR